MTIRFFSLLLIISFISCQKKENKPNKFIGVWNDTEYIVPNKTTLKINKDSSFVYESAGCDWRMNSKGKWKMKGDSIELNTISKDICDKLFPFVYCVRFEERNTKELSKCNFTGVVYFSKEIFYLKNDSLIYKVKKSSKCPDTLKIVFARTPKIRK